MAWARSGGSIRTAVKRGAVSNATVEMTVADTSGSSSTHPPALKNPKGVAGRVEPVVDTGILVCDHCPKHPTGVKDGLVAIQAAVGVSPVDRREESVG